MSPGDGVGKGNSTGVTPYPLEGSTRVDVVRKQHSHACRSVDSVGQHIVDTKQRKLLQTSWRIGHCQAAASILGLT